MREIKFRAWYNAKMLKIDDDFAITLNGERIIEKDDEHRNTRNGNEGWGFEGYPKRYGFKNEMILMQFTGLLDKNGKEIYEGDIVKRSDKKIGEVLFHFPDGQNNIFGWILKTQDSWYSLPAATFDGEIIGNIYENPELINLPNK